MPFVYFGGKKGLARYYPPPPPSGTIVEPFAGSAGYSLHWATPRHRVILVERDPAIAALWRRLQAPDARDDLMSIPVPEPGERSTEPFIACAGAGVGVFAAIRSKSGDFAVTSVMAREFTRMRARMLTVLPRIREWTLIEGDYHDAPDIAACWFIDPPYWVPPDAAGTRGDGYRHGASGIDFDELAGWCRSRKGQVIVCEQQGAPWLPFRPLRRWATGACASDAEQRLEVVWTRTPGRSHGQPAEPARTAAARRRAARTVRSR